VLILEGGGLRLQSQIIMLKKLEEITGNSIANLFTLIVGAGTGALLAAAISLGINLDQIPLLLNKLYSRDIISGLSERLISDYGWYDKSKLEAEICKIFPSVIASDLRNKICFVTSTEPPLCKPILFRTYNVNGDISKNWAQKREIPCTVAQILCNVMLTRGFYPPSNVGKYTLCDATDLINNLAELAFYEGRLVSEHINTILVLGSGLRSPNLTSSHFAEFSRLSSDRYMHFLKEAGHFSHYWRFEVPLVGDINLEEHNLEIINMINSHTNNYFAKKEVSDNWLTMTTKL